jgi:D-arabinose 1-dehydrogenase-like Zn-dependent alcohol dehydrogenase
MAVVQYGQPLQVCDVPVPEPGHGQVLLRVRYCGVCYSDYKVAMGRMPFSAGLRLPHVGGHEISGEVVGSGALAVVYIYWGCGGCPGCWRGEEQLCRNPRGWAGFTTPGGFQEYLVVPEPYVVELPDGIAAEHAATLGCATASSYRAVVTRGRVQAGETVLVIGVGGVGLQAVQIARASGARVLAVDVDKHKLEWARELGAVATAPADARAVEWARDLTDGGVDVAIDAAGRRESVALAGAAARSGGRVVLVGYSSGEQLVMPSADTVLGEISYAGSRYATRDELRRAIELVASGAVQPTIDRVLDLADVNAALNRLGRGEVAGRIVLQVS